MLIRISALNLVLTDLTPFYSQLYSERLIVKSRQSNNDKTSTKKLVGNGIVFEIVKFVLF